MESAKQRRRGTEGANKCTEACFISSACLFLSVLLLFVEIHYMQPRTALNKLIWGDFFPKAINYKAKHHVFMIIFIP